jgi:hypothetical protein
MLTPTDEEFQRIADMALKAGILDQPLNINELLERSFIPADIQPAKIEVPATVEVGG